MTLCPCGSGAAFDACCQPILADTPALTAEALLRSRYSAFVTGNLAHIENTHAPEIRASFDRSHAQTMIDTVDWQGLEIIVVTDGGAGQNTGQVEFRTRFNKDGQDLVHHELASFRRDDGRWLYVAGKVNPRAEPRRVVQIGRNDPCPCGSGKKYKKCCGA